MNLSDHLDNFERRLLADALNTATASCWDRRADLFEWAKPRPSDYPGKSTVDDLRAAWRRCDDAARACRARAKASTFYDVRHEVVAALEEAA